MRYLQKEKYTGLRDKYSTIIGWGAGVEFQKYYDHEILKFDHVIDGAGRNIGQMINGVVIQDVEAVRQYQKSDSVLVVIYPNIENEILMQVQEVLPQADTIMARLIAIEGRRSTYSADGEDRIILDYMKSRYQKFTYMDIGVCHPIVRNNTYLFYENGLTRGVLVEPNLGMCDLAREYRPLNRIVNFGASPADDSGELTYYYDPIHPGLNTFLEDVAVRRGMQHNSMKIPMKNINTIIDESFETYPDVLDIDTEGLDLELLKHLDFERFPVKLICVEAYGGEGIRKLMEERGYELFRVTTENEIYVLK